jgi:hypothetical protein
MATNSRTAHDLEAYAYVHEPRSRPPVDSLETLFKPTHDRDVFTFDRHNSSISTVINHEIFPLDSRFIELRIDSD